MNGSRKGEDQNKYFQSPQKDCEDFFTVPTIPSTAKEKLSNDGGNASTKVIFADKGKARLEEQMKKIDEAAHFGAKAKAVESMPSLLSEPVKRVHPSQRTCWL